MDRAVHSRLHHDFAHVTNLQCLLLHLGAVGVFIKALALGGGAADVEVDRAVLVLERQHGVRTGAQTTANDLLNAAHVPPRVQNVDLTHKAEVDAFRNLGRRENHTDQTAVHVLAVPSQ